jgi:hypothetical protein
MVVLIPQLLVTVKDFISLNMERRAKARSTLADHETNLKEHVRLYENDAPTQRKELETKVAEMKAIVEKSEKKLLDAAKSQAKLWGEHIDFLPERARNVLIGGLVQLKQLLPEGENSPMSALMKKCETIAQDKLVRQQAEALGQVQATEAARAAQAIGGAGGGAQESPKGPQQGAGSKPPQQQQAKPPQPPAQQQQQQQQQAQPQQPAPPQVVALIPLATRAFTQFNEAGQRKWYEGSVEKAHTNDTYDVRYCDGELFKNVPREKLHLLEPDEPGVFIGRFKAQSASPQKEGSGCVIS